jgi:nickel/cobalt transporter (NiCoT) family protein
MSGSLTAALRRGLRGLRSFVWSFISLSSLLDDGPGNVRGRVTGIAIVLIVANMSAWLWALSTFSGQPVLLGTAVLAYSLGLRHGLDPDHIAAIDNVTRKLMQDGKRPVAVGFFFALGHSAVVVVASIAVALAARALNDGLAGFRNFGGIIGTSASAIFLFAIAIANIVVLASLYRAFRRASAGDELREEDFGAALQNGGWLARLFRPLFGFVSRSWHLFPIGLLFALGFETASEISLFGLSAQASGGLSSWSVLVFPSLFAAAMTLVDTADGILMLGAYGWAFMNPARKLFYNLTITSVSIVVAVVIGGIEVVGLVADQLGSTGMFGTVAAALNKNFGMFGYVIVAVFLASWGGSTVLYHLKGSARRDAKPDTA